MERETTNFTKADVGFAAGMLVFGFLYWDLITVMNPGAGVAIFTAALCLAAWIYFRSAGIRQNRSGTIFLVLTVLLSFPFLLFDNVIMKSLDFVFLSVCFVYWTCLSTGRQMGPTLSVWLGGDLFNQCLIVPFSNFACCPQALKSGTHKSGHGKSFLAAIAGIVIFLPVLAVVVSQLVTADAAFENLIDRIRFSLSADVLKYIMEAIVGIPVAFYLYGLLFGNLSGRHTEHITPKILEKNAAALKFAPGAAVSAALTALNVIYAVFFLAQTAYLFSGFGGSLPETMTYAEYARRGFFELCTVAGINLFVIIAAYFITKRNKTLRVETAVLCLFTMMLIVTAISKMVMYIDCYGLTQLRLYTAWFMLFLLVVFSVLLIRQLKSFNGARIVIVSFIVFFMLLSFGNADGLIAKYNIDRFSEGTLKSLDVAALSRLSDAAVPYLFDLYQQTDDAGLKAELKAAISGAENAGMNDRAWIEEDLTFRSFNLQHYNADQIRATLEE